MTTQATNFMNLCKGGSTSTISGLLRFQSSSIKNELKKHFNVDSDSDLALSLSLGR